MISKYNKYPEGANRRVMIGTCIRKFKQEEFEEQEEEEDHGLHGCMEWKKKSYR